MLRLAAPVGLAFIPLGIALGLLITHAGLAWWWAPVFAAVLYAGSLEFLMVGLAATAAPVVGVMVILALYTLRRMPDAVGRQQLWSLLAVGATIGLHLWRARPLLSILAGTAIYVVLMSVWP